MSETVQEVPIRDESIRLGQLLKLAGIADQGTLAKELIDAGTVSVDGAVETRRGAQVHLGQTVDVRADDFGLPERIQLRPVNADPTP